jgi:hypothetical protein
MQTLSFSLQLLQPLGHDILDMLHLMKNLVLLYMVKTGKRLLGVHTIHRICRC